MRRFAAPPLREAFSPSFVRLLHELLGRAALPSQRRADTRRARRAAPSQSGSFVGHRAYVRGDDLRRLDWAAYARSGEMYVKLVAEEERRTATLLIDLSPRLCTGSPPRRLWALRLSALLAGLALRRLDGLLVLAPGAGAAAAVPFAGAADLPRLLRHLDELPVVDAGVDEALALCESRASGGPLHWISDFARPDAALRALVALRRRGARVHGWLPAIVEDERFAARGYVDVADPSTGEAVAVPIDAAFVAAVEAELEKLQRRQERVFAEAGALLRRWRTPARDDACAVDFEPILAWCAP